jgi:myo-inositol-1-phosphate synthase
MATIKIMIVGMGFNEKTLLAMNPTAPNSTINTATIPGHTQMLKSNVEIIDMVIAHTVIFRQNDFDSMLLGF